MPPKRRRKRAVPDQPALFADEPEMPYGLVDLDPILVTDRGPPLRLRCVVCDCPHFMIPPARSHYGQTCPTHGIRVHTSGTYSYRDPTRNFIVEPELVRRIIRHPGKFESHRLGLEKSEDAATLNLFRSFQQAGCLNEIGRLITGLEVTEEPQLFLWGICL